eukprot:scaffold1402_cov403-Prasinococcus_capsulatus_cf.AAC.12
MVRTLLCRPQAWSWASQAIRKQGLACSCTQTTVVPTSSRHGARAHEVLFETWPCGLGYSTAAGSTAGSKEGALSASWHSKLSNVQLLNRLLCSTLLSSRYVAVLGAHAIQSGILEAPAIGGILRALVRSTFFAVYCGGQTLEDASADVKKTLALSKWKAALDLTVETATSKEEATANFQQQKKAMEVTKELPGVAANCLKISAFSPPGLLEKVSRILRYNALGNEQSGNPSVVKTSMPWFERYKGFIGLTDACTPPHDAVGHLDPSDPLSPEEEQELSDLFERLCCLCEMDTNGYGDASVHLQRNCGPCCRYLALWLLDRRHKHILVDAEYWSQQPAIDLMTHALMSRFNKERAVVHGTVQAYLRGSLERLRRILPPAKEAGIHYGVKLVRGAYMETERRRAAENGVLSPINSQIEDTHREYDACAATVCDFIVQSSRVELYHSLWLATHNKASVLKLLEQIRCSELGTLSMSQFHFAQLKGMGDSLSDLVAREGLPVAKRFYRRGNASDTVRIKAAAGITAAAACGRLKNDSARTPTHDQSPCERHYHELHRVASRKLPAASWGEQRTMPA